MAEKELAAFVGAVSALFGSEQSRQAADDWLEELALLDWPTGKAMRDFHQVTIAAAARLARRVRGLGSDGNPRDESLKRTLRNRCR
jgi:hypothetical protein